MVENSKIHYNKILDFRPWAGLEPTFLGRGLLPHPRNVGPGRPRGRKQYNRLSMYPRAHIRLRHELHRAAAHDSETSPRLQTLQRLLERKVMVCEHRAL